MKPFSYCCLLLMVLLSSCRVYERIVHPYRIPTPPPSPEYKAKLKADKERKKGLAQDVRKKTKETKKAKGTEAETTSDDSVPIASSNSSAEETRHPVPDAPKLKYDKRQLIKKNKLLLPKKRYKVPKPSFGQRVKNFFKKKKGKKKKSTPKPPPDVSSPTDPNSIP